MKTDTFTRIRRKAELCINPSGNVGEIWVRGETLCIEVRKWDFGNFVDSKSLANLLKTIQHEGYALKAETMWIGMFDGRMCVHVKL